MSPDLRPRAVQSETVMEAPLLPVNGGAAPSSSTAVATVAAGSPPPLRNPSKHARLQALDLVRGFTVWLMIFVDEVGGAMPLRVDAPFPPKRWISLSEAQVEERRAELGAYLG